MPLIFTFYQSYIAVTGSLFLFFEHFLQNNIVNMHGLLDYVRTC